MSDKSKKSERYRDRLRQQVAWTASTASLPEAARANGTTFVEEKGRKVEVGPYPICLPPEFAHYNLIAPVRDEARRRFHAHRIEWHNATPGPENNDAPTTHLLSSQVQCVNVLLTLSRSRALERLARWLEPEVESLVAIEDGSTVAFEWMGLEDHLGEARTGEPRHRGRWGTSADALFVGQRRDGRTAFLVEWKDTETYPEQMARAWRLKKYAGRYRDAPGFSVRPPIEAFAHEAHYQLLRLALLGQAMVDARELGVDRVVLVNAMPLEARELRHGVPDGLRANGDTIDAVWSRVLPDAPVRYVAIGTDRWLGGSLELAERYGAMPETRRTPPQQCSSCGREGTVVPILYGYPSESSFAAKDRGDVVFGGCTLDENAADFRCRECDAEFGTCFEDEHGPLPLMWLGSKAAREPVW